MRQVSYSLDILAAPRRRIGEEPDLFRGYALDFVVMLDADEVAQKSRTLFSSVSALRPLMRTAGL